MNKGFTLIELLAVIIILGFVAILTIPAVNDAITYAKKEAYNTNIDAIKKAASDWSLLHTRQLPEEGDSILVYLTELKSIGSVDMKIKNPMTGKYLSNNTSVTITNTGGKYEYTVNLVEINNVDSTNIPMIIIEGDVVDYVEVNQDNINYTIPEARDINNQDTLITYQIFKDNELVTEVDESSLGVYKIVYTATSNGISGNYEKTVMVVDTTKPILDVGENIVCTVGDIPSDLLVGVTVTDNSGETITPTIDSRVQDLKGSYYVYYTATDSSGNAITLRREVVVND